MLLLRVIVALVACWIVKCDLLDLYVQHMDETMRTRLYSNKRHSISRRIKRNLPLRSPSLWRDIFRKKPPFWDEDWLTYLSFQKKIASYKNDGLGYPNVREENLDPDQHEMLSSTTQDPEPEETSITPEDIAKEDSQSSINVEIPVDIQDELNSTQESEEQKGEEDYVIYDCWRSYNLFPKEEIFRRDLLEQLENLEGTKNDENSQFEIIGKNLRVNPRLFGHPSLKRRPKRRGDRVPKKYLRSLEKLDENARREAKGHVEHEAATRLRRSAERKDNRSTFKHKKMQYESLDEKGDVILEWDPSDKKKVTFRVTAKTLGYVGIGFNDNSRMKGADILLAWVDDHTGSVSVLDSHGIEEAAPVTDTFQDVQVLSGSQNETHTVVTFSRDWETCDPQDHQITGDSVRVLWALHQTDPELNTAIWHGDQRGSKTLRLKVPMAHTPPSEIRDVRSWDVRLNQYEVDNTTDTVYWCKVFNASLEKKHHMIGYVPLVEKTNEALVHHITLYECVSTEPLLARQTKLAGSYCYSSMMPSEWKSCTIPVVAWARGSKGEWLPKHVGIPIAEHSNTYYMLEVHYNNPTKKKVIDSSGVRLYLTSELRPQEAGILVTGVAMSPFHFIPPKQKAYATVGYCTRHCTNQTLPEDGINIISVFLHSHLAGRRLSLKHIRGDKELPKIVQDNHFDFDYQQSHTLEKEVKVLPGDELIMECVYGTLDRTKPTMSGYAASQEMCLAFVMHYPKTSLASCYSMTSVKNFFKSFGVNSFEKMEIDHIEKQFMSWNNSIRASSNRTKPRTEDDNIFTQLIIKEPAEFQARTMAQHIQTLPWGEELLTRQIEDYLYHGKHLTFCRKTDDQLAMPPSIQTFPNYTALPETNYTTCTEWKITSGSAGTPRNLIINSSLVILIVVSIIML